MRIGIDVRTFSYRLGGITQYTYQLVKHLLKIDSTHHYYLFNYNRGPYRWDAGEGQVRQIVLRMPQRYGLRRVWEEFLLPYSLKKQKVDLFFAPDFYVSSRISAPSVLMVHDLMFLALPEFKGLAYTEEMIRRVRISIKKAAMIIVPSEYTSKDLQRFFQVPDTKIRVIHEASDDQYRPVPKSASAEVMARYGISGPFILFVGQTTRQKNLHRICRAFASVKRHGKGFAHKLVVVGKRTADTDGILREIDPEIAADVIFCGYVPDEDLVFFYNAADLFVFPSRYEGFGIPVLEAMRCGVPVLASKAAAIPEIAGDAALLVNPEDQDEITQGMISLLSDASLSDWLRRRGLDKALMFTWEKTARETLEVFEEILSKS